MESDLKIAVNKYNLDNRINFIGGKIHSEVMDYMYDSDILIAPSHEAENGDIEGIPTVLMEAMSTGLPVITTYHSGIPELVQDSKDATLCKTKKHEELANKLQILINDYDKMTNLAFNARKTVEIKHDINKLNGLVIRDPICFIIVFI